MKPNRDLKEACVIEALAIVDSEGLEKLSLREVARRLGVSHQAPYKHFESRDHILAEIVARAFDSFAKFLDAHPKTDDPEHDIGQMGHAYIEYAKLHPLQYRLMFGTPLPDSDAHPEMMRNAQHAFDLLRDALRRKAKARNATWSEDGITLDAMFIWSGLHGLCSLMMSSCLHTLHLPNSLIKASSQHVLSRFGDAMETRGPGSK